MMNTRVEMNEEMMAMVNGGAAEEVDQDGIVLTPERKALRESIRREAKTRSLLDGFMAIKIGLGLY